jgi:2,4-dienoyl-CoA reductase-like NADH-dependent reductase (Old Yellow Enzyme family)
MIDLFTPFAHMGLEVKNRIVMAPMCQYSAVEDNGMPTDWHYTHYTSRAIGGAGLITFEMTDVDPDGRTTNMDLGIWSDKHIQSFSRIVDACHEYGSKMSMQIAHAGRKAEQAKVPVAPSAIRFDDPRYRMPRALQTDEVKSMIEVFAAAARRAVKTGIDTVEIHGAHGYLIHQFHSPLTNQRSDVYGQDLALFGTEVIKAVKSELPSTMPLVMRISAVEYIEGGYGLDYMIELARKYREAGIDLFHISSGGEGPFPDDFPAHQVPFARKIKQELNVPVIVAGVLGDPVLAQSVICNEDADLISIGRGMLHDPYWAHHAAQALGYDTEVPKQYQRAF